MMVTFVSQCEKNALKKICSVPAFTGHKAQEYMFNAVKAIVLEKSKQED